MHQVASTAVTRKVTANAEMDEVWEASDVSDSENEGTDHSDVEEQKTKATPQAVVSAPAPLIPRTAWAAGYQAPKEPQGPARPPPLVSQVQPAAAQTQSMMTLVTHLRKDNLRLRELLVEAQREAEKAVERATQAAERGEETPHVDFGHLLELVKEFGDGGFGGDSCCDGLCDPHSDAQVFAMDSPREVAPSTTVDCEHDVVELQAALASRDADIARRDAEIAALRAELAAKRRCSCGSQAPTDVGDGAESDSSANMSSRSDDDVPPH